MSPRPLETAARHRNLGEIRPFYGVCVWPRTRRGRGGGDGAAPRLPPPFFPSFPPFFGRIPPRFSPFHPQISRSGLNIWDLTPILAPTAEKFPFLPPFSPLFWVFPAEAELEEEPPRQQQLQNPSKVSPKIKILRIIPARPASSSPKADFPLSGEFLNSIFPPLTNSLSSPRLYFLSTLPNSDLEGEKTTPKSSFFSPDLRDKTTKKSHFSWKSPQNRAELPLAPQTALKNQNISSQSLDFW